MPKLFFCIKNLGSYIGVSAIVLLLFLVSVPVARADITSNLISHWTFDDGSGSTAVDSGSAGNNGTINGTATWIAGKVGSGALSFDGSANSVETTAPSVLSGSSVFTVSFWAKPVTSTAANVAVSIRSGTADDNGFNIVSSNSHGGFGPEVNWPAQSTFIKPSSPDLADGSWHFFTFVSRSATDHELYVDGTSVGTSSVSEALASGLTNVTIGAKYSAFGGAGFHDGPIDDVRIYSRALSNTDITDLYALGNAATPPAISAISVSTTTTTATITWTTNDNASSTVKYGTTSGYGNASTTDSLVTSHQIILSGLAPSTTYHYQVASGNPDGVSTSSDSTFTTASDVTPPVISSVASTTSATAATITWNTDEAATSKVAYGTVSGTYTLSTISSSLVTSHSVGLSGLTETTKYFYVVVSADSSGNRATSSEYTLLTGSQPATDITSGLVDWWKLDEGSGATAVDSGSGAHDGNSALAPLAWTAGKIGPSALAFDGVTNDGILATGVTNNDYASGTVSWWQYPTSAYNDGNVKAAWGQANATDFECMVHSDANWYCGWDGPTDTRVTFPASSVNYPTNTWSFYTLVWNSTHTDLYMNGLLIGTNSSAPAPQNIAATFFIGAYNQGFTDFRGNIDDVRIYNRALTSDDISALYAYSGSAPASAPAISSIATSTTSTTATITWTTDQNASSSVSYGLTSSYGSASTTNTSVTSHQIILSGLTASTVYHYQVASGNTSGVSTSSDATFTTAPDTTPPVISSVASTTAGITASITWTTDEAATSKVAYGTASGTYTLNATSSSLVTSHTIGLSGLLGNTNYFYVVVSADSSGNTATSSEHTFLTGNQDPTPPVISSIASTTAITTATVTWTTDEVSTSKVSYGTTTGTYTQSTSTVSLTTSHSLAISGLVSSTTYYFVAVSTDPSGNVATSSEQTFTTTGSLRTLSFYKYEHTGNGTVTATVNGAQILNCGSTCTASVPVGATITFTATPVATSTLFRWEDCPGSSSTTTCVIDMPDWDMSMGAIFTSSGFTPLTSLSQIVQYAIDHKDTGGLTWVYTGDSFATLNTFTAYIESYFHLHYPNLHFHFRNMGRSGSFIAYLLDDPTNNPHRDPDSGNPVGFNVDGAFDQAVYGLHPNVVSIAFTTNGHPTTQQLHDDTVNLIDNYILPIHASPVILGAWPSNSIQAVTDSPDNYQESLADVNSQVGQELGITTGVFWHQMAPIMMANLNSADPVNLDGLENDTDQEHLNEAATLLAATLALGDMGADPNVSSVTVDANSGTLVSESEATTTNVTKNAYSGVDFTRLDARLPMAFDDISRPILQIGATTTDGMGVLDMNKYMLTVNNLTPGNYEVYIDGVDSATVSSTELASGWNMTKMTQGPIHDQLVEVLGRIRDKEGVSRTRLFDGTQREDPSNTNDCVPGGFNFWGTTNYGSESGWFADPGWRGDFLADVKLADAKTELACLDGRIEQEALPTAHVFSIRLNDTAGPVLSSIASSTTSTTATITWTTDESASSTVKYGSTSAYGIASTSDTFVTSHSIIISGLTDSTLYHYQVVSTDAYGNSATSSDLTFTTAAAVDVTPPVISSIATSTGANTATITWSTDEGSNSSVSYGLTTGYGSASTTASLVTSHTILLSGLTGSTLYHFKISSTDASNNTANTSDLNFTTSPDVAAAPSMITSAASSISTSTAILNGSITSTHGFDASQSGFAYGTASDLHTTIATSSLGSQTGTASFSSSLTGLTANTTYYFRAYATNTQGTGYGTIQSFTTTAVAKPTVTTQAASSVDVTSATLNGTITATGNIDATARGFVYGTTGGYGATTTPETGVFSTGLFTGSLTGLACGTTYHYAAYATNTQGTGYGSDQTFTPPCLTIVSNVSASSVNSTTETITWTSDVSASSKVDFGINTSYGTTTTEFDTVSRVTSHSLALAPLVPCTLYHYRARSKDASNTQVIGSDNTFTTSGCTASASVSTSTILDITSGGGTLNAQDSSSLGLVLTVPSSFSSTTSQASFQAKKLNALTFTGTVAPPGGLTLVNGYIYNLEALSDATTSLHSFDHPLTVSITYADGDLANFDPSTLAIERYDGSTWTLLSGTVSTSTKTVTATTTNFSDFGLFGVYTAPVTNNSGGGSGSSSSSSSGGGGYYIPLVTAVATTTAALPGCPKGYICTFTPAVIPVTSVRSTSWIFTRDLTIGSEGIDVKALQQFLNGHGYIVATTGPGSPGNETTKFGNLTHDALAKFQNDHAADLRYAKVNGYFGAATREVVISLTLGTAGATPVPSATVPPVSAATSASFPRDLGIGIEGSDVMALQLFLNNMGFTIAKTGPGSPGNETTKFGNLTQDALIKFQAAYGISATGFFGPLTRAKVAELQ